MKWLRTLILILFATVVSLAIIKWIGFQGDISTWIAAKLFENAVLCLWFVLTFNCKCREKRETKPTLKIINTGYPPEFEDL